MRGAFTPGRVIFNGSNRSVIVAVKFRTPAGADGGVELYVLCGHELLIIHADSVASLYYALSSVGRDP